MRASRASNLLGLGLVSLVLTPAFAANDKPLVPPYVLQAHTVAVMIDPGAGVSLKDPNANQTAQKDVEKAILKWGRFVTVMGAQQADLVIVLRKGKSKAVEETVGDPRQNSRAGSINPTDDGISIDAQHGPQPGLSRGSPSNGDQNAPRGAQPQLEVGTTQDSFEVYEGNVDHPMDGVPGWRWVRKDGLHPHDVPAVAEFRKAIEEAEKQAAQQTTKHP
jgi:hypothetical protein